MQKTELQSFIRSNGVAWPGCYPMALMMLDGEFIAGRYVPEFLNSFKSWGEI